MKKLINQIMKFGIVGGLAFVIDYGVFVILANGFQMYYPLANVFGFVLSLIFNYVMSMKFVFERKEGTDRRKEFIIFTILSSIGLLINELIIITCVDGIYLHNVKLQELFDIDMAKQVGKIVATGIVMVYNFISRKLFIEGHGNNAEAQNGQKEA